MAEEQETAKPEDPAPPAEVEQKTPETPGQAKQVQGGAGAEAGGDRQAPRPSSRTAPPLPEGQHYVWGTGRRKASVARVRIRPGQGKFLINKRQVDEYFRKLRDRQAATAPLVAAEMVASWDIWANVRGGGTTGQAGAVRMGLARALAKAVPELEHDLREKGLLTRDARMTERKKYGRPGARKRFQFSKR